MSIPEIYRKQLANLMVTGAIPMFAPNTAVEVGDVGLFAADTGEFEVRSNKVVDVPTTDPEDRSAWDFGTKNGYSIEAGGDATVGGETLATAKVVFKKGENVVASFAGVQRQRAKSESEFDKAVAEAFRLGNLRSDRVVVWQVERAASGTVIVSETNKASVKIRLPLGTAAGLAALSAGVGFEADSGVSYKLTGTGMTTWVMLKRIDVGTRAVMDARQRYVGADDQEFAVRPFTLDDLP